MRSKNSSLHEGVSIMNSDGSVILISDIDECASNLCVNGDCSDVVNSYTCVCHAGYEGQYCNTSKHNMYEVLDILFILNQ